MLREASLRDHLRPEAATLDDSGIVAILNAAGHRDDIVPLWVGEGDLPTPAFIRDAVARSLEQGETFYTYQRGIPALREALLAYHQAHWPDFPHEVERFYVTSSGMQAIQLAAQATVGTGANGGDEAIMMAPCWPNIHQAVHMTGAVPVQVPLDFRAFPSNKGGWSLDVEKLRAAVTPRTRMIFVNTPANPTGWTATRETLQAILDLARERDLWIVADEVYGRFTYDMRVGDEERAPSFYDIATPEDRILFVNTFSKNWAMTGFRLGWIAAPPAIGGVLENMIQYASSGSPVFLQRAAVTALGPEGEAFFQFQRERARANRDVLCDMLRPHAEAGRVAFARPPAALYLFFRVAGERDSLKLALRLIDEALVAPAPGAAFYSGGEGHLRLCFLRDPGQIERAAERLDAWLSRL